MRARKRGRWRIRGRFGTWSKKDSMLGDVNKKKEIALYRVGQNSQVIHNIRFGQLCRPSGPEKIHQYLLLHRCIKTSF